MKATLDIQALLVGAAKMRGHHTLQDMAQFAGLAGEQVPLLIEEIARLRSECVGDAPCDV